MDKRLHIYCFLVLAIFSITLYSQNLVPNPSFEKFNQCPEKLGNFGMDVTNWSTPTEGTSDYYNSCSTTMGAPKNINGNQLADFGNAYAGLYFYGPEDYREYLQTKLINSLEAGKSYQISFYINLAERSDFAITELGVLFSNNEINIVTHKDLSRNKIYSLKDNRYHFERILSDGFFEDTADWLEVSTQFVAEGTEVYMIIGNFNNNAQSRTTKTKRNAKQGAYYYLDMVALKETVVANSSVVKTANKAKIKTYENDKVYVFQDILFDFDKKSIAAQDLGEIRDVYNFLMQHQNLIISIRGHTDNIGSVKYNQKLSENRASAVVSSLLEMGLEKNRISSIGFGAEMPKTNNNSEENRQLNRRVEFVISTAN